MSLATLFTLGCGAGGLILFLGIVLIGRQGDSRLSEQLRGAQDADLRDINAEYRAAAARERMRRFLDALGRKLGPALGGNRAALSRRLLWAGWTLAPEAYVALQVVTAGAGFVVGMMLGAVVAPGWAIPLAIGAALFGWVIPDQILGSAYTRSRGSIGREALGYGDFLISCLNAGLQLDEALVRLGGELQGRLPGLMAQAAEKGRETSSGIDLALEELASEINEPTVSALVAAIAQARATGGDLAGPLAAQMHHLRNERQQRIRAAARSRAASGSMPMLFVFVPGVFLPIGYVILNAFSKSGF